MSKSCDNNMNKIGNEMNNEKRLKIESEVLKKLITHLQKRTDVQNIDLMNSKWFL